MFMANSTTEYEYLVTQNNRLEEIIYKLKNRLTEENIALKNDIEELQNRRQVDQEKNKQEYLESLISQPFTWIRSAITLIICLIFIVIDCKILWFVLKTNLTTLDFTPDNLKIIKYGFLFLASQLVIFSQGFGFSSIVKLMERFSSKKNAKEVKEATKVEN